ncbi:hypothetical protein AB8O55_11550 [Saccharopolyspora cebuensis]|uniref:Uncharacterized protein n=1 Tax=Saccharopolyspora cebuensis TaxID=418759 RepID=A0ABV4CJL4_9PSEU
MPVIVMGCGMVGQGRGWLLWPTTCRGRAELVEAFAEREGAWARLAPGIVECSKDCATTPELAVKDLFDTVSGLLQESR